MSTDNLAHINAAQKAAEVFIEACKEVRTDHQNAARHADKLKAEGKKPWEGYDPTQVGRVPRRATMKRKSMDLTRALATLRRS